MFQKPSSGGTPKGSSSSGSGVAVPSVISSDMVVKGDLWAKGDIYVDGTVEGDVQGRHLVVGDTGAVNGSVLSDTVVVHGRVDGTIKARDVVLMSSCHVDGDVIHGGLEIQRGAAFSGSIKFAPAEVRSDLNLDEGASGAAELTDSGSDKGGSSGTTAGAAASVRKLRGPQAVAEGEAG
jgi:cytoskeletal protein CcmA (bactofilin family)